MRHHALFALATLSGVLAAQDDLLPPYQEGDVEAFLEGARDNNRSSIVLFNFNLGSG